MDPVGESTPIPRTASPAEVLRVTAEQLAGGRPVILATVLGRGGSAPGTPGQKLALLSDGEAVGTVGGGALELWVLREMLATLRSASAELRVERLDLKSALGMVCGGWVEILIEPLRPPQRVLIVGGGHIGAALAPLLSSLGLAVVLCDAREGIFGDQRRLSGTQQLTLLQAPHDGPEVAQLLGAERSGTALLVMTHTHQLDEQVIEWGLRQRFGFVGGVGSRGKAKSLRRLLAAKGLDEEVIAAVRMPLGVDIGARSPQEIAISITAEIIRWRAGLRAEPQPPAAGPPGGP